MNHHHRSNLPEPIRVPWVPGLSRLVALVMAWCLVAGNAESAVSVPELKVTVGSTHAWNDVAVPASGAKRETIWSYSHSTGFTVPDSYEPGMVFLLHAVIGDGEYLRSESFSLIDAEGKTIAQGLERGMPATYTASFTHCTFVDAPASYHSRQFRRYASHGTTWIPGQRFQVRFGFSRAVPLDAKIMVAFVKSKQAPHDIDQMMPLVGLKDAPIFGEWLGRTGLRGLRLIQNEHRLVEAKAEAKVRSDYRSWAVSHGPVYPTVGEGATPWGWTLDQDEQSVPPSYARIPASPKATPAGVEAILGKPDLVLAGSTYAKATRYKKTDGMLSDLPERWMYFYDFVALITAPGKKDGPFEWMRVGCGPMMPARHLPEKGHGFCRLGDTNAHGFFKDGELTTVITRFGRRAEKAEVIGAEPAKAEYLNYDVKRRLTTTLSYEGEGKWLWTGGAPEEDSVEERHLTDHKFEGTSQITGRSGELLGEAIWKMGMANGKAWWKGLDGQRHEEDYRGGRKGTEHGERFLFEGDSLLAVPE